MGWARFDDNYTDHTKVRDLSALAELLDMRAIIHCARHDTDGLITPTRLKMIGHQITKIHQKVDELVAAGRWKTNAGGGWWVHDYLAFNPSKAQKNQIRALGKERQQRHREARNGVTNAYQHRGGDGSLEPEKQRVRLVQFCEACGKLDVDCQCHETREAFSESP